jgi:hypothetical protein
LAEHFQLKGFQTWQLLQPKGLQSRETHFNIYVLRKKSLLKNGSPKSNRKCLSKRPDFVKGGKMLPKKNQYCLNDRIPLTCNMGITHFVKNHFVENHKVDQKLSCCSSYGIKNPKACRRAPEVLDDKRKD